LTTESVLDPRTPAPAPGQPRPPQILALTSIRFFAALHVTLYHLVRPFSLWGPFTGFVAAGYTGVSFFFLLSGFILCYSHAQEREHGAPFIKRFYFARFARIYPVYLVAQIAAGYVLRSQFDTHSHALAYLADLFMIQTWSLRMVSFFNVPAWSVASEVFFYLVFPLLFLKLRPSSRTKAMFGVGAFWLLAMIAPVIALVFYPQGAWHEGVGIFAFWVRRSPLLSVPEFLAGVSLAWLYLRFPPKAKNATTMVFVAALALAIALFFADDLPALMLHNGLLIPLYAVLFLGLAQLSKQDSLITRALSWSPLVLLGEASYALYLTHYLFGVWLDKQFHVNMGLVSILWKLAIIIPISIALHLFIERPCRKSLLLWWNSQHPRPAVLNR
jgi:peptidoglycan/LPS O-acetylase OafA/YrhL